MAAQKRIHELEKLLREAELRAEESEKLRAEEQKRADTEQQRADASEEQTRPTTLLEYIDGCHNLVFAKFAIERDKALTSKGSITNPRNKLCPTSLKQWPEFIEQQRKVSGALHTFFPLAHVFESRSFLSGLGDRISKRPVANEKALEYFLHNSVEDPVKLILQQLKEVNEIGSIYDIGGGVVFENHPSAISDIADEVVDRETSSPPRTPYSGRVSNQLRPDQICVYRSDDGLSTRHMIYVCEYKAPHKLTAPHLRVGLRPMNVYTEVVNRKTIPPAGNSDERFQYFAERLTAAAISQTYHYMVEGGLEHGLLTTGEAIVFLKIDWDDPSTLYYHLAEPGPEVSAHPSHFHYCTAVGQYLAFTLMALGHPGQRRSHGQEKRHAVIQGLKTWAEDFNSTLRSIPASERCAPSTSSGYKPTTYELIDRSPYPFRFPRRQADQNDERNTQLARRNTPDSSDDDISHLPDTPTPVERRAGRSVAQGARRSKRIDAQRPIGSASRRGAEAVAQYCTQKCLSGLVRGELLDVACPNVAKHGGSTKHARCQSRARHPLSHRKWLQLLQEQLQTSLDSGITPLWETGSRGALFQVTLLEYGYTFICKGTVHAFVKDLEHEARVYERLTPLQGASVPVFLGSIDLRAMNKIYYYDHRVYVVYMLFLSWAGYKLDYDKLTDSTTQGLPDKALQSLRSIHRAGVAHKDVRFANMLYCPEVDSVMIIDFERSVLLRPSRRALEQVVPNKRKRSYDSARKMGGADCESHCEKRGALYMSNDFLMANTVFAELSCCKGNNLAPSESGQIARQMPA
ncbi:hypothetical protein NLG97_g115 [Lecanicillium saksenae]|uniref:Uncharacterized protein n=1 Tax=Lecanicillium saksenae TaxID=468837 RepID=A0ACC1R863_9HYPO|nr:hypothetical protein NLG97_g115 [Lecanicillium saksenae]